jgi:nucleoside-diphosphate kinase
MFRLFVIFKQRVLRKSLFFHVLYFLLKNVKIDYSIECVKSFIFTKEHIDAHYAHLVNKPFYPELFKRMVNLKNVGFIISSANPALYEEFLKVVGPTDPIHAAPDTIRGLFSQGLRICNIIHCSRNSEDREQEISLFEKFVTHTFSHSDLKIIQNPTEIQSSSDLRLQKIHIPVSLDLVTLKKLKSLDYKIWSSEFLYLHKIGEEDRKTPHIHIILEGPFLFQFAKKLGVKVDLLVN